MKFSPIKASNDIADKYVRYLSTIGYAILLPVLRAAE